jgi:sugar phosphate isomerase/epimerase
LIAAIDRPAFAVHLDPVNMINSPQRFFGNGAFIKECVAKLGPRIRSIHAKDVTLGDGFITHLDEVRPGLGALDYYTFLREVDHLDDDMPVMLEHLPDEEAYRLAAEYVRGVARSVGVGL